MAHLWKQDDLGKWVTTPVDDDAIARWGVAVMRIESPLETWALLVPPASLMRLNGEHVPLGFAVLSDRDELHLPGDSLRFFSSETLARVEPSPDDAGGFCPR